MIEVLLDALLEEVARCGRRTDNGFKSVSLRAAVLAMAILVGDDTANGEDNVTGHDPETPEQYNLDADFDDDVDVEQPEETFDASTPGPSTDFHAGYSSGTGDSPKTTPSPPVVLPKRRRSRFTVMEIP
ncbi:hypothetical protein FRX31_028473 [Thalictrum thalictroides]|uniref:Uncharacterized protein n=1 Tax=Thalictrum thalictroides TaxID=46969 RepID=A0A7J6VBB1_THATH|nr:hypothetical protein FRX31_028473 [Thalictrum thalictroides]